MRDKRNTTTVETVISVAKALDLAPAGSLSPEQERLLRMRSGSSGDARAPLELKGQSNPETRAKLAMIEALAIQALSRPAPARPARTPAAENPTKALIIARLRAPKS